MALPSSRIAALGRACARRFRVQAYPEDFPSEYSALTASATLPWPAFLTVMLVEWLYARAHSVWLPFTATTSISRRACRGHLLLELEVVSAASGSLPDRGAPVSRPEDDLRSDCLEALWPFSTTSTASGRAGDATLAAVHLRRPARRQSNLSRTWPPRSSGTGARSSGCCSHEPAAGAMTKATPRRADAEKLERVRPTPEKSCCWQPPHDSLQSYCSCNLNIMYFPENWSPDWLAPANMFHSAARSIAWYRICSGPGSAGPLPAPPRRPSGQPHENAIIAANTPSFPSFLFTLPESCCPGGG